MDTTKLKLHIVSFAHTFLAVFIPIFIVNLNSFDFTTISKESLIAFGVATMRATVKALWNMLAEKYAPSLSSAPKNNY
jgi:hypothetical protein